VVLSLPAKAESLRGHGDGELVAGGGAGFGQSGWID